MFDLSRGRAAGAGLTGTLADAYATGGDGFSGMVPASSPVRTDPDAGGRVDDLGRREVHTNPQPTSDLVPIAGQVTRPMLGGLRTAPHNELFRESPPFDGSHVVLHNRVSVMVLAPNVETLPADEGDALPSLRVPPVSDPYGRVCANAEAARNASQGRA